MTTIRTHLKSTTKPSHWDIWSGQSWKSNPGIHNNLLKHLSQDTLNTPKRSWAASVSLVTSSCSGEQQLCSVIDQSCWLTAFAKFWSAWLIPNYSGILKIWYTRQKPAWLQESSQHHGTASDLRNVCGECFCMKTAGCWSLAMWYHRMPAQIWPQGQASYFWVGISNGSPNSVRFRTTLSNDI